MALGTPVIGTAAYGQGSTLAVAYPASVGADDQLLFVCVQRPSGSGGGTFTPPAGWTTVLSLIDKGGYGSAASDTGNMNLFVAAKDALAAGGETGTLNVTLGGNGVTGCAMVRVPTGGGRITFDVTGGEDTSAGSVSVAFAADPGIKSGDVLLWGMAIPTDVTTPSQFSAHSVTASGATIGSATELVEFDSTAGNDLGGFAAWASCTAGASSGVPTVAATAGGTTTNVRGPVGLVVIRENAGTVFDRFNKSQYIATYGGDLTATNVLTNVNAGARIRSTNSVDDHRYYETLIGSLNSSEQMLAVGNSSASMSGFGEGADLTSYKSGGNVHVGGSYTATISSFTAADVVGTEIDPAQGVRWRVNGGSWSSWFALPSGSDFYHVSMLRVLDTGQQTQTLNFGQTDGSGFAYSVPSGAQGWDQVAPAGTPVGRADESDTAYALARVQIATIGRANETDTAYALNPAQVGTVGRADEADGAYALTPKQITATGRANETDTALALAPAVGVGLAIETDTAYARAAVQLLATGRSNETDTAYALASKQIRATGRADETDTAFALSPPQGVGRANETDTAYALAPKQVRATGLATETDTAAALGRAVGITRANEADTAYALALVAKRATGRADEADSAFARTAVQIAPTGRANETDVALTLTSGQSSTVGLAIETDTATARSALLVRGAGRSDEADTAFALAGVQRRAAGLASEADAAFAREPVSIRTVTAANENDEAFGLAAVQVGATGNAVEIDTAFALFPSDYVVPPIPSGRRATSSAGSRRAASNHGNRQAITTTGRRAA